MANKDLAGIQAAINSLTDGGQNTAALLRGILTDMRDSSRNKTDEPVTDGADGADGAQGIQGIQGIQGVDGLSAHDIAVAEGFVGNEAAWLASLNGADGADGADGAQGIQGIQGEAGLNGADGLDGADGADGVNVVSAVHIQNVVKAAATLAASQALDGTHKMPLNATPLVPSALPSWCAVSGDTVTLDEDGIYSVSYTMFFRQSSGRRASPCSSLSVAGALYGAKSATGYMRSSAAQNESSNQVCEQLVEVTGGGTKTIEVWIGNEATVASNSFTLPVGESSLTIKKLS